MDDAGNADLVSVKTNAGVPRSHPQLMLTVSAKMHLVGMTSKQNRKEEKRSIINQLNMLLWPAQNNMNPAWGFTHTVSFSCNWLGCLKADSKWTTGRVILLTRRTVSSKPQLDMQIQLNFTLNTSLILLYDTRYILSIYFAAIFPLLESHLNLKICFSTFVILKPLHWACNIK